MRLGCVYRKYNMITKTLQQSGGWIFYFINLKILNDTNKRSFPMHF